MFRSTTDAVTRPYGGGNTAALRTLFSELELTRLLAQLDPAPAIEGHYETITTAEGLGRIARDHSRDRQLCDVFGHGHR